MKLLADGRMCLYIKIDSAAFDDKEMIYVVFNKL